ncbi:hypothetical protein QFC19_003748 [Naganishia cerealis]|uniref:Uncharacterized protein n=1 Tax=Naganishia cerealis TaxID=610337 RepID=A0ACC2W0H9_9TREE|nr:hypothetical protein QFC19_003748 [Naganishia cerealis]
MQPHRSVLTRATTTPAPAPVGGNVQWRPRLVSQRGTGMRSRSRESGSFGTTRRLGIGEYCLVLKSVARPLTPSLYSPLCASRRLAKAITSSTYLLADLRNFNENEWTVRYPTLTPSSVSSNNNEGAEDASPRRPAGPKRGKTQSMTLRFADQPGCEQQVEVAREEAEAETERGSAPRERRRTFRRSITAVQSVAGEEKTGDTATVAAEVEGANAGQDEMEGFSILRLDLSLGHASSTPQHAARTLITSLERHSIARLISSRLESSLTHLTHLHARIMSTHSRVLVTGDLNAGKSTVVNALLRRGGVDEFGWPEGVMPVDQQPLTGRFVEVYGVRGAGEGNEEQVHVVKKGLKDTQYDSSDGKTYDVARVEDLATLVAEQEASAPPLKVYLRQRDIPSDPAVAATPPTILHNGILDISLIDAPGLNRDVIPTTETFTRSPSIDVIIFVVSAANHFTLSAKEFILAAGQEKARMFIVVNRFDEVRDKEKCKRAVLEQIKTLSPHTWAERDELVHFVDSAKIAIRCSGIDGAEHAGKAPAAGNDLLDDAFAHLEQSLRSFVLLNRAKSKLGPAETYLTHLLADVELLASANAVVATTERDRARDQVARVKPVVEAMQRGKDGLEERLDVEEEQTGVDVRKVVSDGVNDALAAISRGQLASTSQGKYTITMPTYPGFLGVWDYAREVRRVMLKSLEYAVVQLEEEAKSITAQHVASVADTGDAYLPKDVERSKRVFNPDAMFGPSSGKQGAVARVGLGARTELIQVAVSDIFDLHHQVTFFKSTFIHPKRVTSSTTDDLPLISIASLGASFSALTLFGGKALGLKTMLDSVVGVTDVLADKTSRRWAGPVVGAIVLGGVAWIIYDLPRAIPHNVGRHLAATLASGEEDEAWSTMQTERVAREARKVIRLASWDLRERFRTALDARGRVVREAEENEHKAQQAVEWFRGVEGRVVDIRAEMGKSVFN